MHFLLHQKKNVSTAAAFDALRQWNKPHVSECAHQYLELQTKRTQEVTIFLQVPWYQKATSTTIPLADKVKIATYDIRRFIQQTSKNLPGKRNKETEVNSTY